MLSFFLCVFFFPGFCLFCVLAMCCDYCADNKGNIRRNQKRTTISRTTRSNIIQQKQENSFRPKCCKYQHDTSAPKCCKYHLNQRSNPRYAADILQINRAQSVPPQYPPLKFMLYLHPKACTCHAIILKQLS